MCPICTIGVAAGLGVSRYLKIDDLIFGLWLGSLLLSLSFWTIVGLEKKIRNKNLVITFSFIFWYALTLISLYLMGLVGNHLNRIWGIDKLILGIIIGTITMTVGIKLDKLLRLKNNNKALFPFQKVIIPIFLLLAVSLIIYFI